MGEVFLSSLRIVGLSVSVEVRHRELEVEAMRLKVKALDLEQGAASTSSHTTSRTLTPTPQESFDVSWHTTLLPPFGGSAVDSYVCAFECIAATFTSV